jgi:hypothetical protein
MVDQVLYLNNNNEVDDFSIQYQPFLEINVHDMLMMMMVFHLVENINHVVIYDNHLKNKNNYLLS